MAAVGELSGLESEEEEAQERGDVEWVEEQEDLCRTPDDVHPFDLKGDLNGDLL